MISHSPAVTKLFGRNTGTYIFKNWFLLRKLTIFFNVRFNLKMTFFEISIKLALSPWLSLSFLSLSHYPSLSLSFSISFSLYLISLSLSPFLSPSIFSLSISLYLSLFFSPSLYQSLSLLLSLFSLSFSLAYLMDVFVLVFLLMRRNLLYSHIHKSAIIELTFLILGFCIRKKLKGTFQVDFFFF